jgi:hypothetical protein
VIDNVVWTDSWPSTASDLICVGAGEEQARKVYAVVDSRCGEKSRLGSRDPVARGINCGLHGSKDEQDEIVCSSLVEPQRQDQVGTTVVAKS